MKCSVCGDNTTKFFQLLQSTIRRLLPISAGVVDEVYKCMNVHLLILCRGSYVLLMPGGKRWSEVMDYDSPRVWVWVWEKNAPPLVNLQYYTAPMHVQFQYSSGGGISQGGPLCTLYLCYRDERYCQ